MYPYTTFFAIGGKMHWSADTKETIQSRIKDRKLSDKEKREWDFFFDNPHLEKGDWITIDDLVILYAGE
jgi:hypothetical protein